MMIRRYEYEYNRSREELVRLIDEILSDYIYDKKLFHCLYTLIRFESNIVDIDKIKEALKELEDKEK